MLEDICSPRWVCNAGLFVSCDQGWMLHCISIQSQSGICRVKICSSWPPMTWKRWGSWRLVTGSSYWKLWRNSALWWARKCVCAVEVMSCLSVLCVLILEHSIITSHCFYIMLLFAQWQQLLDKSSQNTQKLLLLPYKSSSTEILWAFSNTLKFELIASLDPPLLYPNHPVKHLIVK